MGQHPDADAAGGPAGARHVPVLLPRVAELLEPALRDRPAVLVDATLGLGGHAAALLAAHPGLTLVGLDRDPQALALAGRRLVAFSDRTHLVHAVYDRIADVLGELGLPRVDGVLFDLGVSSLQLDADDRGFSYARDADLDMRMDPGDGPTAADVLNTYPVPELTRVLREYGEERFASRIAVLAYHSLEDRMVKRELAERARSRTPEGLPVELPGHGPELRLLTRVAEVAGEDEVADNPRAASVRLRAAERIGEAAA